MSIFGMAPSLARPGAALINHGIHRTWVLPGDRASRVRVVRVFRGSLPRVFPGGSIVVRRSHDRRPRAHPRPAGRRAAATS